MSIKLNNIKYVYMPRTPYEKIAINDISFTIEEGEFVAIAGHTGSGKSTLMQQLNGLLQPFAGTVEVDGMDINKAKSKEAIAARRKIGMVFQYPEQQLFEETVYADIAFGPKNYGLTPEEVDKRVREAMAFVELDFDLYKDKSPFALSGGQMRRVAMAGIIALKPKYLVLDEPTAGLDPQMKSTILNKIKQLHIKEGTTIIMVSHNMDDIAELADKVAIMNHGNMMIFDTPEVVFNHRNIITDAGLLEPEVMQLMDVLKAEGIPISKIPTTKAGALKEILDTIRRGGVK